jgi:hypothetical protein
VNSHTEVLSAGGGHWQKWPREAGIDVDTEVLSPEGEWRKAEGRRSHGPQVEEDPNAFLHFEEDPEAATELVSEAGLRRLPKVPAAQPKPQRSRSPSQYGTEVLSESGSWRPSKNQLQDAESATEMLSENGHWRPHEVPAAKIDPMLHPGTKKVLLDAKSDDELRSISWRFLAGGAFVERMKSKYPPKQPLLAQGDHLTHINGVDVRGQTKDEIQAVWRKQQHLVPELPLDLAAAAH